MMATNMAAYQPQPGGMHPGMAAHHPGMTPGQPMTQAQMQQMGHPGASGPGQPHVSQAGAMMGMQPGVNGMGGPGGMGGQMGAMMNQMGGQSMPGGMQGAQALSQMNPQMQQQFMQQQQQMLQQNPQFMAQQQMLNQRRIAAHQQQQMLQQASMQGLNPQQIQQMQQNNQVMNARAVSLPAHLQEQVLQRQAQQAQQQAQQQQQQQQQMQQMAMQHANSQQSNQSGQGPPQGQQPGHPQQPPQMRPQSSMANRNEQNQVQGQQTPQPGNQGQPQQPTPQPQHPTPQQNMQQQGQQQLNQQQQMAMQQRRMMQHQAAQQAQQAQAQQQLQQQGQMQRMAQAQQSQQPAGLSILRLVHLCDELSGFDRESGKDVAQWHQIIDKHFSPEGRLVHDFRVGAGDGKTFEVPRPTIARYFQMYFDSGAVSVRIHADHPREGTVNGRLHVAYSSSTFAVTYNNGARLEMRGSMNFLFAQGTDVVECMEIKTTRSDEVIPRATIEELLSKWSPTMDKAQSPKMTKKPAKAQQKAQASFEGLTIESFPKTPKGPMGTPKRVQQWLELGETMNIMQDLVGFASDSNLRPPQALEQIVRTYEQNQQFQQNQHDNNNNPQINLPNGVPQGNRTPSMGNMAMPGQPNHFASPAMSNLSGPMMNGSPHIANNPGLAPNMNNMNMPNSHTPSPHQSNMAAPPMLPQHSQQGTNSSAASANTSPNVNNKRRRSTVKMEGDEGGGEGGPAAGAGKVKPSPRMTKKGKPGGGG